MPLVGKPHAAPTLHYRMCEKGSLEPRRVPRFGRLAFIAGRAITVLAFTNGVLILVRWSILTNESEQAPAMISSALEVRVGDRGPRNQGFVLPLEPLGSFS